MSKLPTISGRDRVKALGKIDFYVKRQEGSHMILRRDDPFIQVVIPDHKELDRGTLRAIIRQADLSIEEFIKLLQINYEKLYYGNIIISITYISMGIQ